MQTTPPPITFDPAARGPLQGVRILDLSRLVAGNTLSLQLADFGADVIKVEPPGGDPLRDWRDGGHELHWKVYARNKRSIVLNLHHDKAGMALVRLAAMSDVFIENFRPGTLEKMGLGPDALLRANPDLIIVRVSGFGQTGPYAPLPGFGTLVGSFEPSEINQPTASPFSTIAVLRLPMKRNSSTTSLRMRRTAKYALLEIISILLADQCLFRNLGVAGDALCCLGEIELAHRSDVALSIKPRDGPVLPRRKPVEPPRKGRGDEAHGAGDLWLCADRVERRAQLTPF